MKRITENECIAIKEVDPEVFAKKYREALDGVDRPDVLRQYSDGYFIAIITWQSVRQICESVADEFHLEGLRYVCGQCPYMVNEGDGRKRRHPCRYAIYSSVDERQECCEMFYKQLKQGEVKPRY